MTSTDEELVARSIRGDTDSFNELILRWERPIYVLAYRTIGREEDAFAVVSGGAQRKPVGRPARKNDRAGTTGRARRASRS